MQQHDVDNTTIRKSDHGKAWPQTPGDREAEDDIQQQIPQWRTILKDWENKLIIATKQKRGVHNDARHQPQNTNSLRDSGENTKHIVFKGEPAVKNVKVGTCANENPRQDQVTMGRVDSPLSTNH